MVVVWGFVSGSGNGDVVVEVVMVVVCGMKMVDDYNAIFAHVYDDIHSNNQNNNMFPWQPSSSRTPSEAQCPQCATKCPTGHGLLEAKVIKTIIIIIKLKTIITTYKHNNNNKNKKQQQQDQQQQPWKMFRSATISSNMQPTLHTSALCTSPTSSKPINNSGLL